MILSGFNSILSDFDSILLDFSLILSGFGSILSDFGSIHPNVFGFGLILLVRSNFRKNLCGSDRCVVVGGSE